MKTFALFILLMYVIPATGQQSLPFNHYLFNGLYINPAYSGYKESPNFHSFFKSAGTATGAPQTLAMSVDGPVWGGKGGLGLLVNYEQAGPQRTSSAYVNYAYRLATGLSGQSRLSFGFGVGLLQGALNVSRNVLVGEGLEFRQNIETTLVPDLRVGAFFASKAFFVGFSTEHMIGSFLREDRQDNLLIPVPELRYYVTAGGRIPIFEGLDLKPSFLFRDHVSEPAILNLNAMMVIGNSIQVGAFYRTAAQFYDKPLIDGATELAKGLGLLSEIVVLDRLRIGYAYDYSPNQAGDFNRRSHEIFIGIKIANGRSDANKRLLAEFPF